MTIHVDSADFGKRMTELVAAAIRGETVVLDEAGRPQVQLVRMNAAADETLDAIRTRRSAAFGIWSTAFDGFDTSIAALKADHADPDERFRRKFGTPDRYPRADLDGRR